MGVELSSYDGESGMGTVRGHVVVTYPEQHQAIDQEPRCNYEQVTRASLCALVEEVEALEGRTKRLLSMVLGTVVIDILLRLLTG